MIKTLKGKISIVYLSLMIMIAVVGFSGSIIIFELGKGIDGLMTDNYKSISASEKMTNAIQMQNIAILTYLNIDRKKGDEEFWKKNNIFLQWYNVESNNITESGEKEIVDSIKMEYEKYGEAFYALQEIRLSQGSGKAIENYNLIIVPIFNKLKDDLNKLSVLNEKAMFRGKNISTENSKQSMYVILCLTSLALITGFIVSRQLLNKFLQPIINLTQNIRRIKAGDLNVEVQVTTKDEAGELACEFNSMTKRLKEFEDSTMGQLVNEKNKSLAIVKSIADPIIVLDNNYRIVLLNDAFEGFFNLNENNVIDKHFLEAVRNGEIFDFISERSDFPKEIRQKILLLKARDEEFYFNITVAEVKDNQTNLSGFIVVFQNVTQLKELEKIRTDFIATISHEFKTPLTSIIMGANMILTENYGILMEDQKEVIEAIREDGERLSNLVNELLELMKLESGKAVYKVEPCDVASIINHSIQNFTSISQQSDIAILFESGQKLPMVRADFEKIEWVLNNLISNALKYTKTGDEIIISTYKNGDKVFVEVKDTGCGIPEELLSKIFNAFSEIKYNDLDIKGSGLGLALSKQIVQAHGGDIWCESKIDEGSTFTFTLNIM